MGRDGIQPPSRYLGLGTVNQLANDPKIKFVSGVQAGQATGSFSHRHDHPEEAKWLYLALEDHGGQGQAELANALLASLDEALRKPRISFTADAMDEISVQPYDYPCALWMLLSNHPDRYLMTCKNCHRTVLSTTQGPNRQFCSDSCRVTWSKTHK